MIDITGTTITMTRGDTLIVTVEILDEQGQAYEPVSGDSVRFALKSAKMKLGRTDYADVNPLISKTIPMDTLVLRLNPADTASLQFGDYRYDIELTHASGVVDTFINNALFVIAPEVATPEVT